MLCTQLALIGVPPEADSKTRKVKTVYSGGDPTTSRGVGERRQGREGKAAKEECVFNHLILVGNWSLTPGDLREPVHVEDLPKSQPARAAQEPENLYTDSHKDCSRGCYS